MLHSLPNGINYCIEYSTKRRSIAIQIHHQAVIVRAPSEISQSVIHDFVLSKQTWIKRKLTSSTPDITFNDYQLNGSVWYMGKQYQIKCEPKQKKIGVLNDSTIILKSQPHDTQQIQKQYLKWLQHQAKRMMPDLVNHCLLRIPNHTAFQVTAITCKRTKSKWGHCTHDQRLQFNWIILMAPAYILEYLICHEIAHLAEKNHSKQFWNLVSKLCDHTEQAEQWLKKNGEVLMKA